MDVWFGHHSSQNRSDSSVLWGIAFALRRDRGKDRQNRSRQCVLCAKDDVDWTTEDAAEEQSKTRLDVTADGMWLRMMSPSAKCSELWAMFCRVTHEVTEEGWVRSRLHVTVRVRVRGFPVGLVCVIGVTCVLLWVVRRIIGSTWSRHCD